WRWPECRGSKMKRPLLRAAVFLFVRGRSGAGDGLDGATRAAGALGDLAVLRLDDGAGRLVALETAEDLARDAAVRGLGAVLVDDVEEHELSFRVRFLARHRS